MATVDSTQWRARKPRVDRSIALAGRGIVLEMATRVGQYVIARGPVDTGRFVRAVAQSVNAAGAGPLPMRTISASSRHLKILTAIALQAERAKQRLDWLKGRNAFLYPHGAPRRGRTAFYRRLQNDVRKAESWLARSQRELDKVTSDDGESAVLMAFLNDGRRAWEGRGYMLTVRTPIYGGTGRLIESSRGQAAVELRIMEPHARFVEMRRHLFRDARRSPAVMAGITSLARRKLAALEVA